LWPLDSHQKKTRKDIVTASTPHHPTEAVLALVEQLADDMAGLWDQGQRPLVEDYLARHPELQDRAEAALELLSQEICLRQEHGEAVSAAELESRFPRWRRQVRSLLLCHQAMTDRLAPALFPAAGNMLGEFHLLAELGRGAHARVFLARQTTLADRPVVLKLGPRAGQEHLCLARLQHSHIVPLYSAHDFPEQGLRGLCLPYFGGATLAELLGQLQDRPPGQRSGRDLLDALGQVEAAAPVSLSVDRPACRFLARASYVQAICWLGACLADALQYAQERGLVHLDIKPSNVLLAADGQPMLLDFHLARAPLSAGASPPAWLGGTPGYMAPEQVAAVRAVAECRPVPAAIDGRTDLYALGRLLCEALGGPLAEEDRPGAATRRRNPEVSRGLAALLDRCLATHPAERYADAAGLADDLRRHLGDRPLRGVADRAPLERWRKWRRRRPAALPLMVLLLGALATGAVVLVQLGQKVAHARVALHQGWEQLHHDRHATALDHFRHGAALIDGLPLTDTLRQELRDGQSRAECLQVIGELHRFCERLRPLHGVGPLPPEQARALAERCRRFWHDRQRLQLCLQAHPDATLWEQCRTDLLDLAIVWAHLRAQLAAPAARAAEHRAALELLSQAGVELGASCVLHQECRVHALAVGQKDLAARASRQAAALPPTGAWEHFALGRAFFQAGDWQRAATELDLALERQPGAFWPTFYRGCCACRLGRYDDAIVAFSVCQALAGDRAWCFYNRGLAYLGQGRFDRAHRDLDRALALEPTFAAAALSRGILHYRQDRFALAQADFEHALRAGLDTAAVRYNLALVHLARQDRPAARASAGLALRLDPEHAQARQLLARLALER
jgi:serine/threonine protein kinase/tetratricopeptide (TPR) repeat protein